MISGCSDASPVLAFASQVCERLRDMAQELRQEPGAIRIFCSQLGSELIIINCRLKELGRQQLHNHTVNHRLFKVLAALDRLCQVRVSQGEFLALEIAQQVNTNIETIFLHQDFHTSPNSTKQLQPCPVSWSEPVAGRESCGAKQAENFRNK